MTVPFAATDEGPDLSLIAHVNGMSSAKFEAKPRSWASKTISCVSRG